MLNFRNISKGFPGVLALDDVSFEAAEGEVHALLGENGAGKSTLVKVIGGIYQPDEGEIVLDGKPIRWSSPHDAKHHGIHIIHQELVMFPDLKVYENILLDDPSRTRFGLFDKKAEKRNATALLEQLGHPVDPEAWMRDLSVADQQMVEIAKALQGNSKVLILDEPTAMISDHETRLLFDRVRTFRDKGVTTIYISHRLEEVFDIADRVTVLKDGRKIGTEPVDTLTRGKMISMMVGREIADLFPEPRYFPPDAPVRLEVNDLHAEPKVHGVSFQIRKGEILGLAGLVGSGRTEVAQAVFGAAPMDAGEVILDGEVLGKPTPRNSIAQGIGFLTEDRKTEGLFPDKSLAVNIVAPSLGELGRGVGLDLKRERRIAEQAIGDFSIAARSAETVVSDMSGGNQQKILLSRWVRICKKVLILDEPTRGVDVGAKAEIYRIIRQLAEDGISILMISSELLEIVHMCDRVAVMREGLITGEVAGDQITEEGLLHLAMLEDDVADAA